MSKRGRKRKLELSDDEPLDYLSSDDNSTFISIMRTTNSNNKYQPKKRVKFDQNMNADSSNDKYNKYESSSINLPNLSNYLKVRVGDNENLKDICYENPNQNRKNNKKLWLFHFPPGFDESSMNNLKLSIPKHPQIGERIASFRINNRRYQIIEYDCSQHNIVNLFAVDYKLKVGKPFKRHFHILPDLRPSPNKQKKNKNKISFINHNDNEDELLFGDHDDTIGEEQENNENNENNENDIIKIETVNQLHANQINARSKSNKKNENDEEIVKNEVEKEQTKKKKKKKKTKKKKIDIGENDGVSSAVSRSSKKRSKKHRKKKKKKRSKKKSE